MDKFLNTLFIINIACTIYLVAMAVKVWMRERRIEKRVTSFQMNESWRVIYENNALYVFVPTDHINVTKDVGEIKGGIDE